MIAAAGVRQFVTRTTDDPHSPTQHGHQRVAAGLRQQQVRRQPQVHQRKALGIAARGAQLLEDECQPALVGLADRFGGDVHQ
ncbi:hypothetical protein D3C84_1205450 [compost metagenome]